MKAILINPTERKVKEVELVDDQNVIHFDMQKKIGCDIFTVAWNDADGNYIFVDDEGYLNNKTDYGFYIKNWINPQLFVGNGLVCGSDEEGNTTDVTYTVGYIEKMIQWGKQGEPRIIESLN